MKHVQFLILYKSYFLREELMELFDFDQSTYQLKINHLRFVVIDIESKKAFEFTPFAYSMSEIRQKKKEDMLEIQRIYRA